MITSKSFKLFHKSNTKIFCFYFNCYMAQNQMTRGIANTKKGRHKNKTKNSYPATHDSRRKASKTLTNPVDKAVAGFQE